MLPLKTKTDWEERFWSKTKQLANGCTVWTGSVLNRNREQKRFGYGRFKIDGKLYLTHRLSYGLAFGEPDDLVCHHCDNPPCVNPDHLYAGTNYENCMDSARKQRRRYNELTPDQVKEIRKQYVPYSSENNLQKLADRMNVKETAIFRVVHGKTYTWV